MRRDIQRGWMTLELVVALVVLVAMISALGSLMYSSGMYNQLLLARRQCYAAGQAQLDCITKTGRPVPPDEFARIWPGVECAVRRVPGAGEWSTLELVEVSVRTRVRNKTVEVLCNRYVTVRE